MKAAERGYVDDIIEPEKTREYISKDLELLENKNLARPNRIHGNIPL
jgi:acetyl-CoA carboxylase carboxyltransferase component